MYSSIRGLLYISMYLLKAIIRNKRFPLPWLKWRVETYYAIPVEEFTFTKLLRVATIHDLLKYAKWVDSIRP